MNCGLSVYIKFILVFSHFTPIAQCSRRRAPEMKINGDRHESQRQMHRTDSEE